MLPVGNPDGKKLPYARSGIAPMVGSLSLRTSLKPNIAISPEWGDPRETPGWRFRAPTRGTGGQRKVRGRSAGP
jgi:hypothetical protein